MYLGALGASEVASTSVQEGSNEEDADTWSNLADCLMAYAQVWESGSVGIPHRAWVPNQIKL